ncbi:unnamed protein product, partial [marine sediment metagenome]
RQVRHLIYKCNLRCKKGVGGVLYKFRCLQVTPDEGYLDEIEGPVHVGHDLTGPFRFTTDHHPVRVEKIVGCFPLPQELRVGDHIEIIMTNFFLKAGRLSFTTDIDEAVKKSDVVFIAVGTPSKHNGEVDLSQVETVIDSVVKNVNSHKVVATKSTVLVGTNRWIKTRLQEKVGHDNFDVVSNPEFLREGKATYDFFHP